MTIAETDKQIKGVIDQWSVYGAEAIMQALVRATRKHPYLQPDDLHRLLDSVVNHEEYYEALEQKEVGA